MQQGLCTALHALVDYDICYHLFARYERTVAVNNCSKRLYFIGLWVDKESVEVYACDWLINDIEMVSKP